VYEEGRAPERIEGLEPRGKKGEWIVFEAASGAFAFEVKRPG
jgi:hypothetical protein